MLFVAYVGAVSYLLESWIELANYGPSLTGPNASTVTTRWAVGSFPHHCRTDELAVGVGLAAIVRVSLFFCSVRSRRPRDSNASNEAMQRQSHLPPDRRGDNDSAGGD